MTAAFPAPAWLVGCGNMAGAMVEGWRAAGVDLSEVTVIRPSGTPVPGVKTLIDYPANETPRFVMLGFKPQKLDEVTPGLAPHIGTETILVSMLAGVTAANLRERFPQARAIIRVMPNLPVAQRAGVTPLYSEDDTDAKDSIVNLMRALGLAPWCAEESQIAAIGSISASGPAYFARFAEAIGRAGAARGLDPQLAQAIAAQTMIGTGAFAAATDESMAAIARRVASPKGTTEQGLNVLDAPDGLQPLVDRMLDAALRRVDELAAAAASRN
jgi:pyrroline-5-carboxylate reductase